MTTPLQVRFHQLESSEALVDAVRYGVESLERHTDALTACEVTIERVTRRHHKGDHYRVHIELSLPHGHITVGRDPVEHAAHENAYVAVREAFAEAQRLLREGAARRFRANRRSNGQAGPGGDR